MSVEDRWNVGLNKKQLFNQMVRSFGYGEAIRVRSQAYCSGCKMKIFSRTFDDFNFQIYPSCKCSNFMDGVQLVEPGTLWVFDEVGL